MTTEPQATPEIDPSRASTDSFVQRLVAEFRLRYRRQPRVFFAPGRANLIGAHLDYNGGAVLPVPLRRGTYVAVAPADDGRMRLQSLDVPGDVDARPEDLQDARALGWAAYAAGVWLEGARRGLPVEPVDLLVAGDLPRGAGLSSSASLEVATAFALSTLYDWCLDGQALAELAWTAETGFVGVKCGIMDQFASALARSGHALLLQCASKQWRHVHIKDDTELLVLDTRKPRTLVSSEFNRRVEQCQEALRVLRRRQPERQLLVDFAPEEVEAARPELGELLFRRARHVATETVRLEQAVTALERDDMVTFGRCVRESHRSSAEDYQVSCDELDFLVDSVCEVPRVYGARLTGAGFGGCVLAVLERGAVTGAAAEDIQRRYAAKFGLQAQLLYLQIGNGPREEAVR
jgi:galactokinase